MAGFVWSGEAQQGSKPVQAALEEATLFFQGAELVHSVAVPLAKGENEVWIGGLSSAVDRNSLKIKVTGGAIISAYEYSENYLGEKVLSPVAKKLQDSIDMYRKKSLQIETDMAINKRLGELLKGGTDKNVSGSEKGIPFEELVKTMDYYKAKSLELATITTANEEKLKEYKETIRRMEAQFNQEALKNNKVTGVLKVTLSAPLAANSLFTVSYYTASAGWAPFYDIYIESSDRPVKLISKAKVRQVTGIDWEKVKLTLSTATPSRGKVAPLFQTWFLDFNEARPVAYATRSAQNSYSYAMDESVQMEKMEMPVPAAKSPEVKQAPVYLYLVNGEPVDEQTYQSIDPPMVKSRSFLNAAQVRGKYGVEATGAWIVELKSSMDDYIQMADNELNASYAIDIPYSIPGNGKEQTITLQAQEVNATYRYYCVPKLDRETFLLAEIAQPEKLNLLNGKANITYEGSYIGETILDANSTQANLSLTLGTDKRVSVKREKVQEFSSKKSLGTDIEQISTYKITVRNGRNKPVKMVVKDQYPISTQKEIKVELLKETTKPTFHIEETGVLSWEEELNAGETKTYTLSFSIRYPKNKTINN
ncbi:membrane protein [Bacteroidia bacterium]|nr:membrane protein [Bacteroidia bacterium]